MLKKTMTYTDFDGNERTEDHYFNLTKSELIKMQASKAGGFENHIQRVINSQDGAEIMDLFEKIILMSYGEKSPDGKYFVKSEEKTKAFMSTQAYDDLFNELATNADAAAAFINAILPNDLRDAVAAKA